jgi:sulfatase maturation enzyme AslB (radical SAM superfamily)
MRLGHTQRSCIQLLVLQASSFCNIDCRYCYVCGRDRAERMPDAVLDVVACNLIPSRRVLPAR